jgi:hypothetical protein
MIVSDMANLLLFPFRIFQTEKKRLSSYATSWISAVPPFL